MKIKKVYLHVIGCKYSNIYQLLHYLGETMGEKPNILVFHKNVELDIISSSLLYVRAIMVYINHIYKRILVFYHSVDRNRGHKMGMFSSFWNLSPDTKR